MIGVIVGIAEEARIAAGFGVPVGTGGGEPAGARDAAERLVAAGCTALISFGLAGGLAPEFEPGDLVIPTEIVSEAGQRWIVDGTLSARLGVAAGVLLAGTAILATAAAKQQAWRRTGAVAVDLESGEVARVAGGFGLPFAVLRAICDPCERDLPPASLTALRPDGTIRPAALLGSLLRHPWQLPALIGLGRDADRARRALLSHVAEVGRLD